MVKQNTTISLSEENKLFLDGCKIYRRETYNDILTRIRTGQLNKELLTKK